MGNRKHMRTEKKTAVKNSFGRLLATGIFVLIQVSWLAYLLLYFYTDYAWISLLSTFIAIILVLKIYGTSTNSAMKMPWIIVILAFPILGILIYWFIFNVFGCKKHRGADKSQNRAPVLYRKDLPLV